MESVHKGVKDILNYVKNWIPSGPVDGKLSEVQKAEFAKGLQSQINQMDFSVPKGVTIVGYSGYSNNDPAWKIAKTVSEQMKDKAMYISDLPAGQLIGKYRDTLIQAMDEIGIGRNDAEKIISGYDGNQRIPGGRCGFGDTQSLDDFVSAKLMGESKDIAGNVVVFAPEDISKDKVFATTEIHKIFENDDIKAINGMQKDKLKLIYESSEDGKNQVFDLIKKSAKQVVGDTKGIEEQAKCIRKSIDEGIFSKEHGVKTMPHLGGNVSKLRTLNSMKGEIYARRSQNLVSNSVKKMEKALVSSTNKER